MLHTFAFSSSRQIVPWGEKGAECVSLPCWYRASPWTRLLYNLPWYTVDTGHLVALDRNSGRQEELERMVGLVEARVMICIAGDFNGHVGTAETG